jgi:hypothetical protein
MFPSMPASPSQARRRARELTLETWLVQELCDQVGLWLPCTPAPQNTHPHKHTLSSPAPLPFPSTQGPLSSAVYGGRFTEMGRRPGGGGTNLLAVLMRARDVAAAMEWLHARGVCHGDLK